MSKVEIASASFDAFKRGDRDAYVDSFSEDVEWGVSAFVTGRSAYQGREGIREFLIELDRLRNEQGEQLDLELDEFRELDDGRVLALGKGGIRRESDPLEFEVGVIYSFDEQGKIARLEAHTSHEQARQAAGLD